MMCKIRIFISCLKRSYYKCPTEGFFINSFFHDDPNILYIQSSRKLVTSSIKFIFIITRRGLFNKLDVAIDWYSKRGYLDETTCGLPINKEVDLDISDTALTSSSHLFSLWMLINSLSFQRIDIEILAIMDCRNIRLHWHVFMIGGRWWELYCKDTLGKEFHIFRFG